MHKRCTCARWYDTETEIENCTSLRKCGKQILNFPFYLEDKISVGWTLFKLIRFPITGLFSGKLTLLMDCCVQEDSETETEIIIFWFEEVIKIHIYDILFYSFSNEFSWFSLFYVFQSREIAKLLKQTRNQIIFFPGLLFGSIKIYLSRYHDLWY